MCAYRTIPFGYRIEYGQLEIDKTEAPVVKQIFDYYIDNVSLLSIAKRLSHNPVPYHSDSNLWNKNMVKRIIENTVYTGSDEYPMIIDSEVFQAANSLRQSKTSSFKQSPEYVAFLRPRMRCSCCGQLLKRDPRWVPAKWKCPSCNHIFIREGTLIEQINSLIKDLQDTPEQLTPAPLELPDKGAQELRLIRNEVDKEISKREVQPELLTELLLLEASMKYAYCPDVISPNEYEQLLQDIKSFRSERFKPESLNKIIKQVFIGINGQISIELISRQMFA